MASARSARARSGSDRPRARRLHGRRSSRRCGTLIGKTVCRARPRRKLCIAAHGRKPSSEDKMKKLVVAVPVLALALGGTTACATKKMVKTQVGEVNGKVETLSKSVEETQERTRANEGKIGEVDQKAQAAGQRADAAGQARGRRACRGRRGQHPRRRDRARVQAARLRSDAQRRQGRLQVRQGGDARRGEGRHRPARRSS